VPSALDNGQRSPRKLLRPRGSEDPRPERGGPRADPPRFPTTSATALQRLQGDDVDVALCVLENPGDGIGLIDSIGERRPAALPVQDERVHCNDDIRVVVEDRTARITEACAALAAARISGQLQVETRGVLDQSCPPGHVTTASAPRGTYWRRSCGGSLS
jgi:hypothetical protein